MKSLSNKRALIECSINNEKVIFLLDTGACVGLIDENSIKKYKISLGRRYNGTLIGAGGNILTSYVCNTIVTFNNRPMTLFITSDISNVQNSIRLETGYLILGIIGLPLMQLLGITIRIDSLGITID